MREELEELKKRIQKEEAELEALSAQYYFLFYFILFFKKTNK